VPDDAGTAHPSMDDDIKVVELKCSPDATILSRGRVIITMEVSRFNIDGVGEWEISIANTVYPPREDTLMLCRAVANLPKWPGSNAIEIGCGTGLVSMVLKTMGWGVTAYDVNPYAVACARGNMEANGLYGKFEIIEAEFGGDFPIPEDTDLIVWNLPYLDEDVNNPGILEKIEEAALTDIKDGGWGGALLDNLEKTNPEFSENVMVILVMRTEPEGHSKVLDWEQRGWSWRSLSMERYGSEKVETIVFWRTGSGTNATIVDSCQSTMDEAKKLPPNGWQRILSKSQTNGRGRRGSNWISEEGGLFATWSLDAELLDSISPGLIQTSIGAAVSKVLEANMKWPNDIVDENGVKIGGVLVESSNNENIRVGVGANKIGFVSGDVSGAGWEETLGGVDSSEVFLNLDREISSIFEGKELISSPGVDFLTQFSWKSLSKLIARGALARLDGVLYRPIGLKKSGELELVCTDEKTVFRDLGGVEWILPKS